MKKLKKWMLIALCIAMIIAMTGCKKKVKEENTTEIPPKETHELLAEPEEFEESVPQEEDMTEDVPQTDVGVNADQGKMQENQEETNYNPGSGGNTLGELADVPEF